MDKAADIGLDRDRGTALITGASAGVGAAYAKRLACNGYDLILVARHADRLRTFARALTDASGRSVETLPADLTNGAELAEVENVLLTDASVTLLVNNACVGEAAPSLLQTDVQRMERMIALNVMAPTRLACAAAQAFAARGRGAIVNIASVAGVAPEMQCGADGASQAFILALSHSLHQELACRGIRVQAVLLTRCSGPPRKAGPGDGWRCPPTTASPEHQVDASLCGFQRQESVTIPSLANKRLWEKFEQARKALVPHLMGESPAPRYNIDVAKGAPDE